MTGPKEIATTITVLLQHAPALREAGFLKLAIGEVLVELAPREPAQPDVTLADATPIEPEQPKSLWDDPDLYGRQPNAKIPGIRRPKEG